MEQAVNNKNKKRKKAILFGLGITATGILGYFGWDQYKKYKEKKKEESDPENSTAPAPSLLPVRQAIIPASTYKPPVAAGNDDFPLKRGSRGEHVKQLQQALVAKYGTAILKNQLPNGIFGPATTDALKQKGYPAEISESYFNLIVKQRDFNPRQLSEVLKDSVLKKNYGAALSALKKINSKDDYAAVNNYFSLNMLPATDDGKLKHHTLVTAMLMHFPGEEQKRQTSDQLLRMGLQFDGDRWSLAGISLSRIITIKPTLVWKDKNTAIKVPANLILGYELDQHKGFSLFQNIQNQQFIVKTNTIKYI